MLSKWCQHRQIGGPAGDKGSWDLICALTASLGSLWRGEQDDLTGCVCASLASDDWTAGRLVKVGTEHLEL